MEHLNRRLKDVIHSMGANVTPKAIVKAEKTIGLVHHICQIFKKQTTNRLHPDHYLVPPLGKDFLTVLSFLKEEKVFIEQKNRQNSSYKHARTILEKHSSQEIIDKIEGSLKRLYFI